MADLLCLAVVGVSFAALWGLVAGCRVLAATDETLTEPTR